MVFLLVLVKNDEGGNNPRNPSETSEDGDNDYRPATPVNHCERRENDGKKNSKARHGVLYVLGDLTIGLAYADGVMESAIWQEAMVAFLCGNFP